MWTQVLSERIFSPERLGACDPKALGTFSFLVCDTTRIPDLDHTLLHSKCSVSQALTQKEWRHKDQRVKIHL